MGARGNLCYHCNWPSRNEYCSFGTHYGNHRRNFYFLFFICRCRKTSVAINEKDVMKADGGIVYKSSRFDGGIIVSVEGASVRSTTSNQQLQSKEIYSALSAF